MKKIFLFVSPHPDDAELGIGGTIIKLRHQGHDVYCADLTSGEPTPYGNEEKRKRETEESNRILRINKRFNCGLENRYLFDLKENRVALAEIIRIVKPDVLFCPHPDDAHPDHKAAASITEGARFYAKYTKTTMAGEPYYTPRLLYYFCSHLRAVPSFSFLVDISSEFPEKMDAVRCYRSQFIDNPNNRFILEYVETQNKCMGNLIQADYAEALYSREAVKIGDLTALL